MSSTPPDEYLPIKRAMTHYAGNAEEPNEKLACLFEPSKKDMRIKLVKTSLWIYAIMGSLSILIFSIYWGSLCRKNSHMGKVKILVVVEDSGVISDNIWNTVASGDIIADWKLYRHSEFMLKHNVSWDKMGQEAVHIVHDQKAWISLFVKPNTSDELASSLLGNAPVFNMTNHVNVTYEGGRDTTNVVPVMLPAVKRVETALALAMRTSIVPSLVSGPLPVAQLMFDTAFNYIDYRPFVATVLMAPLQIGIIFIILLTFFQFQFFSPIHAEMAKVISPRHYIRYRIMVSFISYFVISLFFSFVSLCFQVRFGITFGKSGFVVYWMTTFLMMLAVGGANENVLSVLFAVNPPLLGFWLLFWVISNVSAAFTPMALTNNFYRYGYAWPGHAGLEIYKVILLDLYKGHLGYSYGVLTAWSVVNVAVFPFVIKFINRRLK